MDKEKLLESIKKVEESLEMSRTNKENAHYHIQEGELILDTLMEKLEHL